MKKIIKKIITLIKFNTVLSLLEKTIASIRSSKSFLLVKGKSLFLFRNYIF